MSSKYTHNSKILNLYDKNNKVASQLLYGETFSIINKKVGRYHIKTTYDNYLGFIKIKKILKDLVAHENKKKPVTDQVISILLKEKGYNVARRTVAKYREQMDIPVARLRKSI